MLGAGLVGVAGAGRAIAGTASLDEQLATVKKATEKYADPKVAMADGFKPSGPYVPGMGWHFIHNGRLKTAAAEGPTLTEPSVLTYFDLGDRLVLGAAEFGLPVPNEQGYDESNQPDLFADGGTDGGGSPGSDGGSSGDGGHHEDGHQGRGTNEAWHVHGTAQHLYAAPGDGQTDPASISPDELLTRDRWTELPGESGIKPGDEVTADWGLTGEETTRVVDLAPPPHPDLLSLHAWVHVTNPKGVFAGSNPAANVIEIMPPSMYPGETSEPQG